MPNSVSKLALQITANFKDFKSNLDKASKDFESFGKKLQGIGGSLTLGLTTPLVGLGVASVNSAMQMESLMKGLTAVAGSSLEAASQFERLKEVAKLPGLGLEEAVQGSINLQAAGFSAGQAENALKAFGNALATVGKGKAELDGVILALGQIKTKGKISAEEINQIAERVPQLRTAIKDAFGTANTEDLAKMGIAADQFVDGIVAKLGELPPVTGGLKNAFENLGDSVDQGLSGFGAAIANAFNLEAVFNKLGEAITSLTTWFGSLSPGMQRFIVILGSTLAAIGPLALAFGFMSKTVIPQLITSFKALGTFLTTTGGIITAVVVGIGLVVAAVDAFTDSTDNAIDIQKEFEDVNTKAAQSIAEEKVKVQQLVSIAKDDKRAKEDRQAAIKKLNEISPEYLGNLRLENINTQEATLAVENYTAALLQKAKAQAATEKIVANEKLILDLQEKQAKLQQELANTPKSDAGWVETYFGGTSDIFVTETAINGITQQIQELQKVNEQLAPITIPVVLEKKIEEPVKTTGDNKVAEKAKKDLIKTNEELLKEEERHQIEMAELNNQGENRILNIKKFYAQERLRQLQAIGNADKAEIASLQNDITELDTQINNLAASNEGLIATKGIAVDVQDTGIVDQTAAIESFAQGLERSKQLAEENSAKFTEMGEAIGTAFQNSLAEGKNFTQEFGKSMFNLIRSLIKGFLVQAIAGFAANALATLGPAGIALAAAAPAVVGGLFDSLIPALAEGGVAMGPTLALIGEGRGPEAVIPLEKLPGLMSKMSYGQGIEVFGRLSGNDILLSSQKSYTLRTNTF